MKKLKVNLNIFLFLLFFIIGFLINSNFVNGNIYWGQTGNTNYQSEGGNSFILYGSNSKNPTENVTYSQMEIGTSDYEPLIADLNNDGIQNIVLTNLASNTIKIYSAGGELVNEYTPDYDIMAMPTLSYYITDLWSINILTNVSSLQYSYDSDDGFFEQFDKKYNSDFYGEEFGNCTLGNSIILDYYNCYSGKNTIFDGNCIAFDKGSNKIYLRSIAGFEAGGDCDFVHFWEDSSHTLTSLISPYIDMRSRGLTSFQKVEGEDDLVINCLMKHEDYPNEPFGAEVRCDLINIVTGVVENTFLTNVLVTSGMTYEWNFDSGETSYLDFGVGSQDGTKRIYLNSYVYFTQNVDRCSSGLTIWDGGGTILYDDISYGATCTSGFSNVATADFTKDGSNELCFFKCNDTSKNFKCFDKNMNLVFEKEMFSNMSYTGSGENICPRFSIGDFMTEYDRQCITTVEGIFCFNDTTNDTIQIFNTGYTTGAGSPLVVELSDDSYLGIIYSDSSKGFILSPNVMNYSSCGNGECDDWENDFTCYVDCHSDYPDAPEVEGEYLVGTHCESDSDCAGNLKCEYGVCSLAGFNEECSTNAECLSGECVGGYCTKSGLWALLSASKTQQFGDDTHTNNFISLIIIISVASAVGIYLNIWGGIMVLFSLGIFFTLVGWLSAFILVGFFIVGIIALVFGMMLPKS